MPSNRCQAIAVFALLGLLTVSIARAQPKPGNSDADIDVDLMDVAGAPSQLIVLVGGANKPIFFVTDMASAVMEDRNEQGVCGAVGAART